MQLSDEQTRAVAACWDVYNNGGVLYITGKAGTGKSVVTRQFRSEKPNLVVGASTGIAAVNVGGRTAHKIFNIIPSGKILRMSDYWIKKVTQSGVVLIDEISMARADLIDDISARLQTALDDSRPFGGIGMIFVGDHFQLEPVVPSNGPDADRWKQWGYRSPFFFDSVAWRESSPTVIELTKIFRQEGDEDFKNALNAIRERDVPALTKYLPIINRQASVLPIDGAIRLCFKNDVADAINEENFISRGVGDPMEYHGIVEGSLTESALPVPKHLKLKVGHRVISTVNAFQGDYCNGDLGTVTKLTPDTLTIEFDRGFTDELTWHTWAEEKDPNQETLIDVPREASSYKQIPVRLAYAISVHKSQGMTLKKVHIVNPGKAFAHGQSYVGLSRCQDLATMTLDRPFTLNDMIIHPRIAQWERERKAA